MDIIEEAGQRINGFSFGMEVTNICASMNNPRKYGLFVRKVGSREVEVTDGKGKFWRSGITVIYAGHLDEEECDALYTPIHRTVYGA